MTSISQSRTGRVRARRRMAGAERVRRRALHVALVQIPGRVDRRAIYDVLEDHTGDLWVGTPDGLFRFPEVTSVAQLARTRPKAIYTVANGLPAARVAPSFEDSRGDVWMTAYLGSGRRVVRWQRSTGRFHQYPETDSQVLVRWSSRVRRGRRGDRVAWLEPRPGSASGRPLHQHRDRRRRSAIMRVTALHVDPRGRLWVGTRGAGLFRSDDPAAERPRFTAYTVGTTG